MVRSPVMRIGGGKKHPSPPRSSRRFRAGRTGRSIQPGFSRERILLFAGENGQDWLDRNGGPAPWEARGGELRVVPGAGDILTRQLFRDFFLHLEFLCPPMPGASGQDRGNSGVFLQGRYEIQVLDSFGVEVPGRQDCGAVYGLHPPLVNASKAAGRWQAYDIVFRAIRLRGSRVSEHPRVTVFQNGAVVQNNVELPAPTGGGLDEGEGPEGPLLLQDHGCRVAYRNIWAIRLAGG